MTENFEVNFKNNDGEYMDRDEVLELMATDKAKDVSVIFNIRDDGLMIEVYNDEYGWLYDIDPNNWDEDGVPFNFDEEDFEDTDYFDERDKDVVHTTLNAEELRRRGAEVFKKELEAGEYVVDVMSNSKGATMVITKDAKGQEWEMESDIARNNPKAHNYIMGDTDTL